MPEEPAETPPQSGEGTANAEGQAKPDAYTPPPGTPEEFAEWLKARPEEERSAYDTHTRGLQQGLERERSTNKTLRQELKTIAAKEGGPTKEDLDAISEKLVVAERRIDFNRLAVREGLADADLAWLAANDIGAFSKTGAPDFAMLKAQFPKLWPQTRRPAAQAGAGTNGESPQAVDMNAFIRRSTGRSS